MTKIRGRCPFRFGVRVAQWEVASLAAEGLPDAPMGSRRRVLIPGRVSKRSAGRFLSCEFCQVAKGLLKWEAICRIRVCFRGPKETRENPWDIIFEKYLKIVHLSKYLSLPSLSAAWSHVTHPQRIHQYSTGSLICWCSKESLIKKAVAIFL